MTNSELQDSPDTLDALSGEHADPAARFDVLAAGYHNNFRITGNIADLEAAIQHFQDALNATPYGHAKRPDRFNNLGIGYHAKFLTTGQMADLNIAIQNLQIAVDTTPQRHLDRVNRLRSLGLGYRTKYVNTGEIADLETANQQFSSAITILPTHHPAWPSLLDSAGVGCHDKYQRTGDSADLETAIQRFQKALDATPEDHADRPRRLNILGVAYRDRYNRTGNITDLELAIQHGQHAVDITPNGHPDRAHRLEFLAVGYIDRHQSIGAMVDLKTAIQRFQDAIDLTPKDHIERANRLHNLGSAYHSSYQRTRDITDMAAALQHLRNSLDITPPGHPDRTRRLDSLGSIYGDRYRKIGEIGDLDTALQYFHTALDILPSDSSDRPQRLDSLGIGYHDRYRKTGEMSDLDSAIQKHRAALDMTPEGHVDYSRRLFLVGTGYHDRFRKTESVTDMEAAIQKYQEALDNVSSPVSDRLQPGWMLLKLYAEAGRWQSAYKAGSTAVSLIPLLTPRSLDNADKQYFMTGVVGLTSNAAAAALMMDKPPYEAIQLLELGRAIILGSLNELHTDLSDLEQNHPELAREYIRFRDALSSPAGLPNEINQRYDTAQELERTIQTIRTLSGFRRFLLAPSEDELKTAAASGPIVIINVSDYRCDALIIEKSQLRTVPLPLLHSSNVRSPREMLADSEVLKWLWDTTAKPVLDALGYGQVPPEGCWPRLWWIPTGPLAKFPIHAAGCNATADTVLDRVVSSYSSSVKALMHSRQRRCAAKPKVGSEKVVLIGMPALQYAPREIAILEGICSSMQLQISKPQPYKKDVLSALKDCKIFHFAGHGRTDLLDPSKSSLVLVDGLLEVASLFETNLRYGTPFLAYLSACGTGQVKQTELIDESLHLMAACQLAGFQNVIGTLWEVDDKFCVDIATMIYEWMRKHELSDESVSEGLHHASRSLRAQWVSENAAKEVANGETGCETGLQLTSESKARVSRDAEPCDDIPLYWVPYVHFGL